MTGVDLSDLLSDLESSEATVRNRAAGRLRELGDDRAVEPLFRAIHIPENENHRGSLVRALQTLDCSEHFNDLFQLALHGHYEVQCHALGVLEYQDFAVGPADLAKATKALAAFLADPPPIEKVAVLAAQLQAVLVRLDSQLGTEPTIGADPKRD